MIYFDNSATTLIKPPEVAEATAYAVDNFGNAGRSFYDAASVVSREIYATRMEIAKLIGCDEPLNVAFTSSATESLNMVIGGLVSKNDSVITSVLEHNSVLRPLYLSGCDLCFMGCDDNGNLATDTFKELIKPTTEFLVCTHGSNVTGNITDVQGLYEKCKANGITMILDVAQTFGTIPTNVGMADIFCFTGHKGLFGTQGTGGIIVSGEHDFSITKTGGAGVNSFDTFQQKCVPDIFEVGTLNSHGLYGLQKGVRFVNEVGVDKIHEKETRLMRLFYDGIKGIKQVRTYGNFSEKDRLPIVSLNIEGLTSSELAERLWTGYSIATRAGSHCAPLLHEHFDTVSMGMVRFSFSYFNTEDEIRKGISAIEEITESLG
ncbi:MAG: aminotransferase class V-fold PLP-dependent enzyme [Oscillospiraceae bacterium]|nr:aminotransferase class V-fold PLP-dependent enzyme [Oscillospiraceae bacterium]